MKSMKELQQISNAAIASNDVDALLRVADDFHELATPEALALESHMRGWAAYCVGSYPNALEHFQLAIDINTTLGYQQRVASALGNIGVVYGACGDYAKALEYYSRAIDMNTEMGWRKGVAIVTCSLGNVYVGVGDFPRALEHFQRALDVHLELGNHAGAAVVTGSVGTMYHAMKEYPLALEHYERALAFFVETDDRLGMERVTNNIGGVFSETGDYPQALEYYRRASDMATQIGTISGVANVIGNIIDTLCRSGAFEEAKTMFASFDAMHVDDTSLRVLREMQRAILQESDGELDNAHSTLLSALGVSQNYGTRPQQVEVLKKLRDLAQKRNDFPEYIEFNNQYTQINEEINGKETAQRLAMQVAERKLNEERVETAKHIAVLHSTLPKHIADRVARGEVVNDHYDNAAVLFLDIVGFTTLSSQMDAPTVVALLDEIFGKCDVVMNTHGLMKIKTIGDSYMAASFDSVSSAALAALDLVSSISEVQIRIGIHCGPVVAGVLGKERMQYDVWGDTVNIASRMESTSQAGRIHVSEAFANNLKSNTEYRVQNSITESENAESLVTSHLTSHLSLVTSHFTHFSLQLRGSVDVKGKGLMTTYWLERA